MDIKDIKRFKDLYKKESLKGTKVDLDNVIGKDIVIKKVLIQKSFSYGTDFAVIQYQLVNDETDALWTTTCGGRAIVGYLKDALEKNYLPFIAKIVMKEGKEGHYYLFE